MFKSVYTRTRFTKMNFLFATTLVATMTVANSLVYPTDKLFVPILEKICYDEILDSCGNDVEDLGKPGYQVYCMLTRGGVFEEIDDMRQPKGTINFSNLQMRMYGCFSDEKFIDCAYKTVYKKFKNSEFDLIDPEECKDFSSLENTLAELYRKGAPYC